MTISQNYPLSIVALDRYRFNLIFYDDLFKDKFSKVKSLKLSNIDAKTLSSIIFDETIKLYQNVERLSLLNAIGEENEHSDDIKHLCSHLISSKMKSLKYLNLNFKKLLPCLPKLQNLMIHAIHFDQDKYPGPNKLRIKILSHSKILYYNSIL
ncbi:unnamed protein product [Rotaria sordida]|uniref:Uncharacterized protein n=1 Tax=Rotaria sordida TaxID=392033 RepID=A0A819Q190_9BILA|nr:unnamed protein product [Rotaria sordida]